jgi:putative transposase
MARIARLVAPGLPHHIIQRGNRRQRTFFSEGDYAVYRHLLREWCRKEGVVEKSLRLAIGEAHRRYTRHINDREGWRGHLWQGRFASYVMDEDHLIRCVRYIETNPVSANLVEKAVDWPWSSAAAHIEKKDDGLVRVEPVLRMIAGEWEMFLSTGLREKDSKLLRKHERTGRPLGSEPFIDHLEHWAGRLLRPQRPGPKPNGSK